MEPQDPLEVLFCDLCNTSVPLADLERGVAIKHQGKTIGACCLPALRAPAAASAGTGTVGAVAAGDAGAAGPKNAAEHRLLPLGIALLAAIAAATLFLEYRISQAETRWLRGSEELANSLKSQADVVQSVAVAIDGVVRRPDLDRIQERLGALDIAQQRGADQLQNLARDHTRSSESTQTALQALQEAERKRPDVAAMLSDLRTQVQQQAATLAELAAQPRSHPADAMQPRQPEPAPSPPGLSAELAHHVAKLKDDDAATRFEAVDELLRSHEPLVLEHLLPMTKDVDTFVRRLTVEGLKDFHKPAVVDALIVALADPEEIVRDTAWRSLKDLTGQKLPFEAAASREARARAQQKWQEWWDKNRDSFGT